MQFDGGLYRVLNATGELLPGAIELPSNGSKWELQDISVLQGQEPQDSESEIDNSPPSKDASKASESAEADGVIPNSEVQPEARHLTADTEHPLPSYTPAVPVVQAIAIPPSKVTVSVQYAQPIRQQPRLVAPHRGVESKTGASSTSLKTSPAARTQDLSEHSTGSSYVWP